MITKQNAAWIVTGSLATIAVVGGTTLATADVGNDSVHLWGDGSDSPSGPAGGVSNAPGTPTAAPAEASSPAGETAAMRGEGANPAQIGPARTLSSAFSASDLASVSVPTGAPDVAAPEPAAPAPAAPAPAAPAPVAEPAPAPVTVPQTTAVHSAPSADYSAPSAASGD